MQVRDGYIDIQDSKLYYEIAGTGRVLVLIHGNMLDRRVWDFNFSVLAQRYQVVRYDMRGFGRSGAKGQRMGDTVRDLEGLLDGLSIESAVVCGASMGGVAALHFALQRPERTAGLILVATDLSGFPISAEFAEPILSTHKVLQAGDTATAREIWLNHPMLAAARKLPAADELLVRMVTEYTWQDWLKGRAYLLDPPALIRLAEVAAQTVIITGENDLARFQAIAEHLTREIPRAQPVVMENAAHLPNMEDAAGFNQLVLAFMARLENTHHQARKTNK